MEEEFLYKELTSLSFLEKLELINACVQENKTEVLQYFLADSDSDIRCECFQGFSSLGLTEYLLFGINDVSEFVRATVAREFGLHRMTPELKFLIHDDSEKVMRACITQLLNLKLYSELIEARKRTNNCYLKIMIADALKGVFIE